MAARSVSWDARLTRSACMGNVKYASLPCRPKSDDQRRGVAPSCPHSSILVGDWSCFFVRVLIYWLLTADCRSLEFILTRIFILTLRAAGRPSVRCGFLFCGVAALSAVWVPSVLCGGGLVAYQWRQRGAAVGRYEVAPDRRRRSDRSQSGRAGVSTLHQLPTRTLPTPTLPHRVAVRFSHIPRVVVRISHVSPCRGAVPQHPVQ